MKCNLKTEELQYEKQTDCHNVSLCKAYNKQQISKYKGLEFDLFKKQIEFLKQNFSFINYYELLECFYGGKNLPENAVLLTFDDGYEDHYVNVLPVLMENNIQGIFAMPGKIVAEEKLLDVNKIHFILVNSDIEELIADVFALLNFYRGSEFDYPSNDELYAKLADGNRFDDERIVFIKRLLQNELNEQLRNMITSELFNKYMPIPENAFVKELYLSYEQIKMMKNCGMHFAIHGYDHYWLGKLPYDKMKNDIIKALEVFDGIIDRTDWCICYPYGSYNEDLIAYISQIGCKSRFTTEVKKWYMQSVMEIPRLDTNDFPPKSENYLTIV